MNDFPTNVKEKLNSIISDMADHHWLFSNNPGHDFMRQDLGKLSFYDTMRMIIGMGKGSTNESICSRNSLLPFQGLPTSLKITASLHVMGFCIILASSLPMKLQKKTKKTNGKKTINITTKLTFHQH